MKRDRYNGKYIHQHHPWWNLGMQSRSIMKKYVQKNEIKRNNNNIKSE
jgi:hypothetical protein